MFSLGLIVPFLSTLPTAPGITRFCILAGGAGSIPSSAPAPSTVTSNPSEWLFPSLSSFLTHRHYVQRSPLQDSALSTSAALASRTPNFILSTQGVLPALSQFLSILRPGNSQDGQQELWKSHLIGFLSQRSLVFVASCLVS